MPFGFFTVNNSSWKEGKHVPYLTSFVTSYFIHSRLAVGTNRFRKARLIQFSGRISDSLDDEFVGSEDLSSIQQVNEKTEQRSSAIHRSGWNTPYPSGGISILLFVYLWNREVMNGGERGIGFTDLSVIRDD
jgi:hypothetical protein